MGSPTAERRPPTRLPPPRLIVASANKGKIVELEALLAGRFTVEPRPPELADTVEDGETLEENATKKAVEVQRFTGTAALADDTGLFVTALDGRPGVRTARYGGEHATDGDNVDKLLTELAHHDDRRAEFRTVIALADRDGSVRLATGAVAGVIAMERRGDGGFGYDPVFVPDEDDGRAFAEMTKAEKNRISHRARALQALLDQLDQ